MAPAPRVAVAAPAEGGRRAQRALTSLALLGVAVATAAGYVAAVRDEERAFERVADALVQEAAAATSTVVGQAAERLAGAAALVDEEGVIDRDGFDAFGEAVLTDDGSAVALGVVIPGEARQLFEQSETEIIVRRPGGSYGPAPSADEHFPVVDVVADSDAPQRALGLDYAADPNRAQAVELARDTGRAVMSAPVRLAASDVTGMIVVQPLYRRGAPVTGVESRQDAFVGFVTASYRADDVLAAMERELATDSVVQVRDGGTLLFGPERVRGDFVRTAGVDVAGRMWEVTVRPADGPSTTLPRFILATGIAAELGLLVLFWVTWRYQRRLRLANASQGLSQKRSETLEGLAARLSRSLSSVEVGQALLEQLPPFTGTTAGAVLVLDDDGAGLNLLAADGYRPEQVAALEHVDLTAPSAVATAVHTGTAAWLPSPLSWRGDEVTGAFGAAGMAVAIVPLVADATVGVLVLVHQSVRTFYDDERSLLDTVAALAARALNRARRYDTEHDAAVVLQKALLPSSIPTFPDVSVAVRYLPATGALAVGGDWYDVFPLAEGKIGIAVGDVVGRGVRAAAAMGRLRSAMGALAGVISDPAALLRAFEAHVPTIPDALCATMVYAVVDPHERRLTYLRAGHPPPLLLVDGREPMLLEDAVAPPLGVTGGAPISAATVPFEPGSTLVLYTDGIVERRGEPVTTGLERLRSTATDAVGLDPEACCDHIIEELLGPGGNADDAAVVAVRLEPSPVAARVVEHAARSTPVA